ncbi:hypothetical protein QR685DRAFT_541418 [Neurospora intermedia]|uniref:MSP domain-containing protein n=1 Tax=Neurospora intermedia TaxID=5142 RepID=A0ABR3DJ33_NEUIN
MSMQVSTAGRDRMLSACFIPVHPGDGHAYRARDFLPHTTTSVPYSPCFAPIAHRQLEAVFTIQFTTTTKYIAFKPHRNPTRYYIRRPAGAGLLGTTTRSPSTSAEFIISIKNNDNQKVSATKFRYCKKGEAGENVPLIIKSTSTAEFCNIINKFNLRLIAINSIYKLEIKFNPPPKFDGTKREDL